MKSNFHNTLNNLQQPVSNKFLMVHISAESSLNGNVYLISSIQAAENSLNWLNVYLMSLSSISVLSSYSLQPRWFDDFNDC